MSIQMVSNDCKKLPAVCIVQRKQTRFGRKLSVQIQTKVEIYMSYVITFEIWESLNHELDYVNFSCCMSAYGTPEIFLQRQHQSLKRTINKMQKTDKKNL